MKNGLLTLTAAGMFLLIAVSCKKKQEQPTSASSNLTEKEQVKELSTTPMAKAINLPASLALSANTQVPVIFVHGFLGFGPDEAFSAFHYWGGLTDVVKDLNNQGYVAYAASVGPISSNWDRAIELYYYIKGGTPDYGKLHSSKFGHKQQVTRRYKGVYPQWDEKHPISLIGHSMGGTTIRKLITLLEKGDTHEQGDAGSSSLFAGNKSGTAYSKNIG